MKVLVYSAKEFEISYLEKENNKNHKLTFVYEALSSETAIKAVGFNAISIFSADDASDIVIEKLKDFGVKYIVLRSVGYDNVNLKTANKFGIKVANVPAYSPFAVAEHAVSLLLAINRKLIQSNIRVKQFNFDVNNLIGFDLNSKTVGVIGTGKIGAVFTKIMHGFGCKLLGFDIEKNEYLEEDYHIEYVPLKTLCKESDIISLHVPLNAKTHHLINKELIGLMKENVILINTARGAVINTIDIINALENKTIGALGMDVYEHEKHVFFKDNSLDIPNDDMLIKLNAFPNVFITGHHAFLTDEALSNIAETTVYNLNCWDKGIATENEITTFKEHVN